MDSALDHNEMPGDPQRGAARIHACSVRPAANENAGILRMPASAWDEVRTARACGVQ